MILFEPCQAPGLKSEELPRWFIAIALEHEPPCGFVWLEMTDADPTLEELRKEIMNYAIIDDYDVTDCFLYCGIPVKFKQEKKD